MRRYFSTKLRNFTDVCMVAWGEGRGGEGGGLHERASHHTNVCKIPRLCGTISSLVFNKSLSNWSTLPIFYAFFPALLVDRFSSTGPSQKLKKIMDRKPGKITTCLIAIGHLIPRVSIRSHRPKPSQTPHKVYTT